MHRLGRHRPLDRTRRERRPPRTESQFGFIREKRTLPATAARKGSSAQPGFRHRVAENAGALRIQKRRSRFRSEPASLADRSRTMADVDRAQKRIFGPKNCHYRQPLTAIGVSQDSCSGWSSGLVMQCSGSLIFTSDDRCLFELSNAVALMQRRSRIVQKTTDISWMRSRPPHEGKKMLGVAGW